MSEEFTRDGVGNIHANTAWRQSMSSSADFHARTSAPPAVVRESTAPSRDFGENTLGWFASFDLATLSWKTPQTCLFGGWSAFSGTWPRAGMTRSGSACPRSPLVPLTAATEFSLWPTPNAGDYKAGFSNAPNRQQSSLPRAIGVALGISTGRRGNLNQTWLCWIMGYPETWLRPAFTRSETPSSRKSRNGSRGGSETQKGTADV